VENQYLIQHPRGSAFATCFDGATVVLRKTGINIGLVVYGGKRELAAFGTYVCFANEADFGDGPFNISLLCTCFHASRCQLIT